MKRQIDVNMGNLLLSLSSTMDLVNPSIAQHQNRTAYIALEIAKTAGIETNVMENVFTAALLHDIGAVTVEEKIALHGFMPVNENIHAARGEILLKQIPWLSDVAKIVGNHHKCWENWEDGTEECTVGCSQIILLADYIERLIDRSRYILHQVNTITDVVRKLEGTIVKKDLIVNFEELAKSEKFWLDLVSPRLNTLLLNNGPFKNIQIDLDDILLISNLYRDLIDSKSRFTATHTSGVAECAVRLAELHGMAPIELKAMRIAGNFHDIGKLVIPNSILEKPGKLTPEEFSVIRCHTYYTYHTLDSIGGLQQIAEWAAFHHERLDGTGYPFHLDGASLDTGSRIVSVSDIFTAISEDRPYRKEMDQNEIYRVLKEQIGKKALDKRFVDLLFDNYKQIYCGVKEKQAEALAFYQKRFIKAEHEQMTEVSNY